MFPFPHAVAIILECDSGSVGSPLASSARFTLPLDVSGMNGQFSVD
jgi:hypothetical protein